MNYHPTLGVLIVIVIDPYEESLSKARIQHALDYIYAPADMRCPVGEPSCLEF